MLYLNFIFKKYIFITFVCANNLLLIKTGFCLSKNIQYFLNIHYFVPPKHSLLKVHMSWSLSLLIRGMKASCWCKISTALAGISSWDSLSCSNAVHQPDKVWELHSAPIPMEPHHRWPITVQLSVVYLIAEHTWSTRLGQVRPRDLNLFTPLWFYIPLLWCISHTCVDMVDYGITKKYYIACFRPW